MVTYHPDCQLPDGGDPCKGYTELVEWNRLRAEDIVKLGLEIGRLHMALEKIRDTAYSPRDDDSIWMDDRTLLGQFIDMTLATA